MCVVLEPIGCAAYVATHSMCYYHSQGDYENSAPEQNTPNVPFYVCSP